MSDEIERLLGGMKPHRLGPDAGLAFVKVDPFTHRAYVDRALLAPMAAQGYDVDEYARHLEADLRARGRWPG